MNTIELQAQPSIASSYLKLFTKKTRGMKEGEKLPELKYVLKNITVNHQQLLPFNTVCGLQETQIGITYPYVLAGPTMLALVAEPSFPLPAAGLLHLRNRITQHHVLSIDQPYEIAVFTAESRFRPQGLEFDIMTELKSQDETLWSCKSTFLKKGKFDREDSASEDEDIFRKLESEPFLSDKLNVPKDIGKIYARICKDYNPIHISNLAAKLFGYKRSIAHGMWTTAKVVSHLYQATNIKHLDVSFKGPVFTGSTLYIKHCGNDVNIFCNDNPRPVILARVE